MNKFSNEIYLFSPENDGAIIAAHRAPTHNRSDFASASKLSVSDMEKIKKYAKDFSTKALIIPRKQDCIIVSSVHFPSSRLCLAVTVNISPEAALSMIKRCALPTELELSQRFSKIKASERIAIESSTKFVDTCSFIKALHNTSGIIAECDTMKFVSVCEALADAVGEFVGCNIDVDMMIDIPVVFDFDVSLYTSCLLCLALFAWRHCERRELKLELFRMSEAAAVRFLVKCDPDHGSPGFSTLRDHAKELNLYFDILHEKDEIIAELCPARFDLSLLGLKDDPRFNEYRRSNAVSVK